MELTSASLPPMHGIPDDFSDRQRAKQSLPTDLHGHERFLHRFSFALPSKLIAAIERSVGRDTLDSQAWQLEHRLARLCDGWKGMFGWKNGLGLMDSRIFDCGLDQAAISEDYLKECAGVNQCTKQEVVDGIKSGSDRIDWFVEMASGYCGWLVSDPGFCREQDELLTAWEEQVRTLGFPLPGTRVFFLDRGQFLFFQNLTKEQKGFLTAVEEFKLRWRLDNLRAPFVPQPSLPQIPAVLPSQVMRSMQQPGRVIDIPDTFPFYSKDMVRDLIDNMRGSDSSNHHLRGWRDLIAPDNQGKKKITSFARAYRFMHFWSTLISRHGESLAGKLGKLEEAFAEFLSGNPSKIDAIHKLKGECKNALLLRANSKAAQLGLI